MQNSKQEKLSNRHKVARRQVLCTSITAPMELWDTVHCHPSTKIPPTDSDINGRQSHTKFTYLQSCMFVAVLFDALQNISAVIKVDHNVCIS